MVMRGHLRRCPFTWVVSGLKICVCLLKMNRNIERLHPFLEKRKDKTAVLLLAF